MAYDDDDRSIQDSEPVYLVAFTYPTGATRFNNSDINIVHDSNTWLAAQLETGKLMIKPSNDSREYLVTVPLTATVAQTYKTGGPPPRELLVEIWRYQTISTQSKKEWKGFAAAMSIDTKAQTATFHVPCVTDDLFDQLIPTISLTRTCNAFLYDNRCRVNKASFTTTTTITAVSADGKTITVAANGGNTWFEYGLLEHTTSTEQRSIVSQSGLAMTINLPLRNPQIGDQVKISAGCPREVGICDTRFNNVLNFRGHPRAPLSNPFLVGTTGLKKIP